MIYLYLDTNTIKLFSLSKTLLGQYNISFFEKNHSNNLLENGQVVNIDILASTIKEALTSATPSPITEKELTLILPQRLNRLLKIKSELILILILIILILIF